MGLKSLLSLAVTAAVPLLLLFFPEDAAGGTVPFQRGNANADGGFDVSDAVFTLRFLFQGEAESPICADAQDSNDDGRVDLSDAVYSLGFLFLSGPPIPPPSYPRCGADPTPDGLDCTRFEACATLPSSGLLFANPALEVDGVPGNVAAGDLDGDGDADIATALPYTPGIAIFLNRGEGVFASQATHSLGGRGTVGTALALGDLDHDGALDIAVSLRSSTRNPGRVGLLFNRGDGTFSELVEHDVGEAPGPLTLADLDGDGVPDVALLDGGLTNSVTLLLNRGDGSLESPVLYDVRMRALFIAAGDLDGDGDADIAVTNGSSEIVTVLPNRGDGTMGSSVTYPAERPAADLAIGDLDRDGYGDIVFASPSLGAFVLPSEGDGAFGAPVAYRIWGGAGAVALRDLEGDGDLDVAVAQEDSGRLAVFLNRGDGTLDDPASYAVGREPSSVAAADLDGDGVADLATANEGSRTVSVLLGEGDGAFVDTEVEAVYGEASSLALGDLNGDGDEDLVVTEKDPDSRRDGVSILLNRGGARFAEPRRVPSGDETASVALGDLDLDGDLDLAVVNQRSRTLSILSNSGDAGFEPLAAYVMTATFVAAGDLDGDGSLDLCVVDLPADSVAVFLNRGDGAFRRQEDVLVPEGRPRSLALADLDEDGDLDLAVAAEGIAVFSGHGTGAFDGSVTYPLDGSPSAVAAGDLDGDGDADLAVARGSPLGPGAASLLLNRGDGTLENGGSHAVAEYPTALAVADLDGDGWPDLAVTSSPANTVTVLTNGGGGAFEREGVYGVGWGPSSLVAGDLDGDGDQDLAVAHVGTGTVSILRNRRIP